VPPPRARLRPRRRARGKCRHRPVVRRPAPWAPLLPMEKHATVGRARLRPRRHARGNARQFAVGRPAPSLVAVVARGETCHRGEGAAPCHAVALAKADVRDDAPGGWTRVSGGRGAPGLTRRPAPVQSSRRLPPPWGQPSSHTTVRAVRHTAVSRQCTTRGVGVAVFGRPFVDKRSDRPLRSALLAVRQPP
jgi:hypothetical protein